MHRADHPNRRAMPVRLHPPGQPFDHRMVEVSGGHRIYVEQYGTPGGLPVVVLHGGPGGGIHPNIRRFFDPKCFHVTLFDQRGCGNSRPHASVENNTTWDLIEDIETIRSLLGISRWIVFGGSWGATLGILYAQQHPERVMQLILRGPFLFTQSELDWFYGGGVAAFFPDQWKKFVEVLPEDKRDDVIAGFHEGLFGSDPEIRARYAAAWTRWENGLASIGAANESAPVPADYALAFARLENHYFFNRGFLESDDQILQNMGRHTGHFRNHRSGTLRHDLPARRSLPASRRVATLAASCHPRRRSLDFGAWHRGPTLAIDGPDCRNPHESSRETWMTVREFRFRAVARALSGINPPLVNPHGGAAGAAGLQLALNWP